MGNEGFGQIAPYGFGTWDVWRSRYEQAKYKIRQSKGDCQGCQQHQEDRLEKDDDASQSCSSRGEVWLIIDSIGDGIHDDLLSNEWYAKVNSHFGINITTMP